MSTKIREEQLELPSLRSLISEIKEARGDQESLKDRLNSLVGSGGGGSLSLEPHTEIAFQDQFIVTLPFSYEVGKHQILVFRNGLLQRAGDDDDYLETGEEEIAFNLPLDEGDIVYVLKLGASAGSGPGGSEVEFATAGVTEERIDLLSSILRATNHAQSEYYVGNTLVVDPLADLSGVDASLSSGYIWHNHVIQQEPLIPYWVESHVTTSPPVRQLHSLTYDSTRGKVVLFGGFAGSNLNDTWEYWNNTDPAEVVSSSDELDTSPSQVYFVPHIPDDASHVNIEYYLSLDDGASWFQIDPENLISVPSEAQISNPPIIRAKAVIPSNGRLSGWAYGWL